MTGSLSFNFGPYQAHVDILYCSRKIQYVFTILPAAKIESSAFAQITI